MIFLYIRSLWTHCIGFESLHKVRILFALKILEGFKWLISFHEHKGLLTAVAGKHIQSIQGDPTRLTNKTNKRAYLFNVYYK